jgi:superfamily II DNA or RNA helicase
MDVISVDYIDDVNLKIVCDAGIAQEISDYFTFFVPGYKFMPKFKNKLWDGKIRLFNPFTCLLYCGLLPKLAKFCKEREYKLHIPEDFYETEFSLEDAIAYVKRLNPTYFPHDHQMDAFVRAVQKRRALLISPTASGKSMIIYMLVRYFDVPALIIVPTTTLVDQMYDDFAEYGYDSESNVHKIYSGHDKNTNKPIVVSTWHSVYQLPKMWFDKFKLIIGDEAHLFKAKSLTTLMTKLTDCPYRIGLTGTLDGTETNRLVLEGLFGSVYDVITTKELMEKGIVAQLKIECLVLQYPDNIRKMASNDKSQYDVELDYIVRNDARNKFIRNLVMSLKGNTLILFQFVEKHGDILRDMFQAATDRPVYYISGSVDTATRTEIKKLLETHDDAIAICSSGTFSTGVSVKNLHNVVFSSPSKSQIKVLQSIGRGLRISKTKNKMTLYDIADDLSWKSKQNHTLRHFVERVKIYNSQEFDYKIHKVTLNV